MNEKYKKILATVAATAVVGGCSSMAADKPSTAVAGRMVTSAELEASQQRVNELESELVSRDRDLASANARASESALSTGAASADSNLFPPNPKAGECYARILIPAKYETQTEQVLKRDAAERIEIIPARYETVKESVLVTEASTKLEVIPAVYGEVQERVLVKPASTKIVEIPAVYETVSERVLDKPAHTVWKKGAANLQSANVLAESTTDTGEIMCLVEVPATFRTIEKRVLVTPARTETIEVPAEYKTVSKTVVKTPPTTREIVIPAKYDSVTVTKLVAPANEKRTTIPAEYQTVTRSSKISEEGMKWRQVMCEVNMTHDNVLALQKVLAEKGYYKAGLDGVIGGQTLSAARRYALDNSIEAGSNYIPIEVVKSLGLSL